MVNLHGDEAAGLELPQCLADGYAADAVLLGDPVLNQRFALLEFAVEYPLAQRREQGVRQALAVNFSARDHTSVLYTPLSLNISYPIYTDIRAVTNRGGSMTKVWRGVFPAVTTKMSREGAVDLDATQRSLDRLIDKGVAGVVMLPMLGENASMSLGERQAIIRAAAETVSGRVPLLSGLCEVRLETARTRAREYEEWGAQ